jgi:hypothetical protein
MIWNLKSASIEKKKKKKKKKKKNKKNKKKKKKKKKCNTVGTDPKFNRKIVVRDEFETRTHL